jgi:hypothetical protein
VPAPPWKCGASAPRNAKKTWASATILPMVVKAPDGAHILVLCESNSDSDFGIEAKIVVTLSLVN